MSSTNRPTKIIAGQRVLPGHQPWCTTYDLEHGTFDATHPRLGHITGKLQTAYDGQILAVYVIDDAGVNNSLTWFTIDTDTKSASGFTFSRSAGTMIENGRMTS